MSELLKYVVLVWTEDMRDLGCVGNSGCAEERNGLTEKELEVIFNSITPTQKRFATLTDAVTYANNMWNLASTLRVQVQKCKTMVDSKLGEAEVAFKNLTD